MLTHREHWESENLGRIRKEVISEITEEVTEEVTNKVTEEVTAKVTKSEQKKGIERMINSLLKFGVAREFIIQELISEYELSIQEAKQFISEMI